MISTIVNSTFITHNRSEARTIQHSTLNTQHSYPSTFNTELLGDELHDVGWQHPRLGRQPHRFQLLTERLAPSVERVDTYFGPVGQLLF